MPIDYDKNFIMKKKVGDFIAWFNTLEEDRVNEFLQIAEDFKSKMGKG